MKYLALTLASLIATLSVPARADDAPTLEEKQQLLDFIVAGFADMKPSSGPVQEIPLTNPVPTAVNAAAIKQGLDTFQGTFNFWSQDGENTLIIDSEPAHVPAGALLSAELRWSKAYAGKTAIPLKPATPAQMIPFAKLAQTQLPDLSAKKLRRLEGTLTVRYPGRVATVDFAANEIGKAKSIDDASCRLLSLHNDLITLTCTGKLGGLEVHPMSASGVVLDTQASMRGSAIIHRQLDKDGKLPRALYEKYVKDLDLLHSEGTTFVMNAKGRPHKVLVLKPVELQTEERKVVAHPLPDFGAKKCPAIPTPQYAVPKSLPPYVQFDEAQIKRSTQIIPSRSAAVFGFNNQVIELVLPKIPNSTFATLEVKDLVLKKKGAIVPYDPQGPFQSDEMGHLYNFRMDPADGQTGPVDFDTATGTLVIHYPTRIVSRAIPAPGEPGVTKIEGCEVRGYLGDAFPKENKLRPTLRAFDKAGRELRLGHRFSVGGQDDYGMFFPYRFWGAVAKAEVDVVEEWKDLTLPIVIKPAPPLPKER